MLRLRLNLVKLLLQLVIFSLPTLAFAVAGYIRFQTDIFRDNFDQIDLRAYFVLLIFATLSWILVSSRASLAMPQLFFAAARKTKKIATACATTYVVTLVATFFYREAEISRIFVVLSCALLFLFTFCSHIVFRFLLEGLRRKGKHYLRILVIGADQFATEKADLLLRAQITPCQVVGFVGLPGQMIASCASPLYRMKELPELALAMNPDEAVLAIPPSYFAEIPDLLKALDVLCVPVRAVLDFGEGVKVSDQLFDLGGVPMLDLEPTAAESISYFVMKRAFDLVFSILVLALGFPLMFAIALAIKLTSKGPIFFSQERVGSKGRVFRMYKFRTMRVTKEEESSTRWTVRDDPRCTRIGAFLRRTSLDELPQFINVLKGDMSVVGPRPERPFFVRKFASELEKYNTRHYVKAGITGWAQVNGFRGDTSIRERVQYDLYYLRNWSIGFDIQIILLTVFRGIANRNAY